MYINPILVGVVGTILAEIAIVIVWCVAYSIYQNRKK